MISKEWMLQPLPQLSKARKNPTPTNAVTFLKIHWFIIHTPIMTVTNFLQNAQSWTKAVSCLIGCRSNIGGWSSANSIAVTPTAQMSHCWLYPPLRSTAATSGAILVNHTNMLRHSKDRNSANPLETATFGKIVNLLIRCKIYSYSGLKHIVMPPEKKPKIPVLSLLASILTVD